MSSIRTLTDHELDAVTGGTTNNVTGGAGGNGGSVIVGAAVENVKGGSNDFSVNNSGSNTANGGRGGDVRSRISQRFGKR